MPTSSRIPTRNSIKPKATLSGTSSNNENLPPSHSTRSSLSLKKPIPKIVSTFPSSSSAATTRASQKLRDRSNTPEVSAIEISVQLPSSDGAREGSATDGMEETEQARQGSTEGQNATEGERNASGKAQLRAGAGAGSSKNSLLPVPTTSRTTRSRSRSKSPQILPPSKPTYATLTSRRRSAAAALRRQSLSAPEESSSSSSTTLASKAPPPARRSSLRMPAPKPRPSEILALPVGPPQHPDDDGNGGENDQGEPIEEDELMLLPSERNRGKGEGKEGAYKKWERERSEIRELRSRSRSRSLSRDVSAPTQSTEEGESEMKQPEQREQTEEYDWGGFDAGDIGNDYSDGMDEQRDGPEQVEQAFANERETVDQNESVEEVNFGSDDEDAGREHRRENVGGNDEAQGAEAPRERKKEEEGEEEEEEDRKDFLLLQDQASSDNEPELPGDDDDLPFADQPRYSLSQSPPSNQRDQTPPPPLLEGLSYTEIVPPLSPNTTGEHDEVEPTRFSSSPPPEIIVQEGSIGAGQAEPEQPEEEETRPPQLPSPFLQRNSLSVKESKTEAGDHAPLAPPTPAREVTPLPQAYLQFEHEALSSAAAPSLLSPSSFLARTFARTRSFTPVDRSPASQKIPQLNFVALPSPRSRQRFQLPSPSPSAMTSGISMTRARRPSPLAALESTIPPAPAPQQEWTRGPAFFRSSSFTPPPVRSSFDRKGKGKALNQDEVEEDEESREYWKPGAMTGTSPHISERGQTVDFEEEEQEEDQISLVRQPSSSPSNERNDAERSIPPPTPSKDRHSPSRGREDSDSDASMRSPAASLRSRHSSVVSPPRSPVSTREDFIMSSPVASIRSTRSVEMSLSPQSITSNKKLPATPPPVASVEDQTMLSPSPIRTQPGVATGGEPVSQRRELRRSPSKLEELVEAGKEKLTGLLSFGTPRFVQPRPQTPVVAPIEMTETAPEASTSKVQLEQDSNRPAEEEQGEAEDDEDQPFPLASTQPLPTSHDLSTSNTRANESIFSNFSYAANSTSRRNRRPSRSVTSAHSSLPVIEISSTDAKAAARAAAILKVYHKYVEQGIEGSLARDEASRVIREAEKNGQEAAEGEESDEEEELRTLLLDAEEEVREAFGRGLSVESSEHSTSKSPQPQPSKQVAAEEDGTDEEEEEVRSVLLSNHSRSPSVAGRESSSQPLARSDVESHARSLSWSGLSSVVGEKWTSQEWRRLEQSLVELKRKTKGEKKEIESTDVVEAFLKKWGVSKEECLGDWEWDKLLIRVEAIKARRAKDVREHRAGSQASALSVSSSARSENSSNVAEEGSSSGNVSSDRDDTVSPARTIVKQEEEENEDILERNSDHGSDSDASDSEDEDERTRGPQDDTFFTTNRRLRRTRRTSMPHTRLPTALSNPRLAHIYDDAPAPEKPRLPMKEMLERGESIEPVEATPEPEAQPEDSSKPASSAQRLFSYLGSFVRRSPAPSPTSSKFAPSSSVSPSPEPETAEGSEMTETRLRLPVITPRLSNDKSLPQLSNRKIRPLPHPPHASHASSSAPVSTSTPIASSSRETLQIPEPHTSLRGNRSIRRRRSSGEEGKVWEAVVAIEEAESSREEEERIIELLRSGSAKRKASTGDLRRKLQEKGGRRV
ncbi:hypothetical protein JCM5350_008330 [Sporobolomyces pararoseus]